MPEILRDLGAFSVAVFAHWENYKGGSLGGGAVLLAAVVYKWLRHKPLTDRLATQLNLFLFAGVFVLAALFVAWREQYREVRRLREPPAVKIEYYDKVVHPDQDWSVVVRDSRKPDFKATVLLLRGGRLHVKMQNEEGKDRSAEARGVRILGPCEGVLAVPGPIAREQ